MPHTFFRIRSFFSYWLNAVDEHSLHSPFLFDFYTRVLKGNNRGIESIETLRKKLLSDPRLISGTDPGSGRSYKPRKVSSIAGSSLSPVKFSSIYSRMVKYFKARHIMELGTSFGINTLYLAANPGSRVITFEGAPEIASIATLTFEFADTKNIQLVQGNLEETLPSYLQSVRNVDLAFMDANHRYAPTLRYFERLLGSINEKGIVILDDIHHSQEMEKAWREIKSHRLVYGSVDLFRCGILFFDPSLNKQHVILQV